MRVYELQLEELPYTVIMYFTIFTIYSYNIIYCHVWAAHCKKSGVSGCTLLSSALSNFIF